MLTADQIDHFHTFGFLHLRQLFTADEVATMKREAEEIMSEAREGQPFDPTRTQAVQPFFERRPFLAQIVDDDRIYSLGEDFLGPDFVLDGTTGSLRVGDTGWHGNRGQYGTLLQINIAFYLDPLTRETGALRVVPGSHRPDEPDPWAILRSRNDDPGFRPFGVRPCEIPSVTLETQPGDVVVFTEDLLHAAFGGVPGRHQHAVSFFKNPQTDEEVAYVRNHYERCLFSFHPTESYINSDRPRVQRMVSRLVELGFETLPV